MIGACIICIASFSFTGIWWMLFLGIYFLLLHSFFVSCCADYILNIGILIWNFRLKIWTWMTLPVITIYVTISKIYSQKLACLNKEFLTPIWQWTPHHNNSSTNSSSIFLWSNGDRSNLNKFKRPKRGGSKLKEFEQPDSGWFDLNNVEGNAICKVRHV